MNFEGEYEKQPGEILQVIHDFSADMEPEELISVPYVSVVRMSDGVDVSGVMIAPGSIGKDGTTVHYGLKGGDHQERYKITIRAATDMAVGTEDPRTLEVEHLCAVIER